MQNRRTYRQAFVALSLSTLLAPTAVNAEGQTTTSGMPREAVEPNVSALERDLAGGEILTQADRDLVERVRVRLDNDPNLLDSAQDINIWADAGVVTLWGTVDSRDDKRALGAKVRAIKGVQEVNNRLRVRNQDTVSTPDTFTSTERSYSDFRAKDTAPGKKLSQWWPPDRQVGAGAASINEKPLPGSGSMAETDYTGTTGPSGTWTFSPSSGAIDASARVAKPAGDYAFTTLDRSLVAHIRQALNGDPSLPVSNENVHLKVVSGTVTIEGWVPSVRAKKVVTAKVAEMPGVQGINNQLLVLSRPGTTQPD